MEQSVKRTYRFGRFEFRGATGQLRRDGSVIPLTAKQAATLELLLDRNGKLVSKDEMLSALWPDSFVEEGNLTQNIFWLRKALGQSPEHLYIVTHQGVGYRFAAPVEVAEAQAAPHAVPLAPPAATTAAGGSGKRLAWSAWTACAFAALALAMWGLHGWRTRRAAAAKSSPKDVLIGVLENKTGDPAFDSILRRALQIDFEQSPQFNVTPESSITQTLRQMTPRGEPSLTSGNAREVCERSGGQAYLEGNLAKLGSTYALALEATNCSTGVVLAEGRGSSATADGVLPALDKVAAQVRSRLGESLASVQAHDVPLTQATTGSLEALRAYTLGEDMRRRGQSRDALSYFEHAIALDPNFALAYAGLASAYYTLGETDTARPYADKAYALRDRVTEHERLDLEARHYQGTGQLEKLIDTLRVWISTYPRDSAPRVNLTNIYTQAGRYALAVDAGQGAVAAGPDVSNAYGVLGRALKRANRFAEQDAVCRQAIARKLDGWQIHSLLLQSAFARGDMADVERQAAWAKGTPSEYEAMSDLGWAAATQGRLRQAETFWRQSNHLAEEQGLTEYSAVQRGNQAWIEFEFGFPQMARATVASIAEKDRTIDTAQAMAATGQTRQALELASRIGAASPEDTLVQDLDVPSVRALADISGGRPRAAVDDLTISAPYELRDYVVPYIRAKALLEDGRAAEAEVELQKIITNPGIDPISPMRALALLDLARAKAVEGDVAAARGVYSKFFDFWKGADTDLPVLGAAQREAASIKKK